VTSLAVAVNTSFHAISRAKSAHADLLLVHHRSWPEIDLELVEEKHARLRDNGMSLYCAHSALDGAAEISNGDGLAQATGVTVRERFLPYHGGMAGVIGTTEGSFREFVDRLRSGRSSSRTRTASASAPWPSRPAGRRTRPTSGRRRPAAPTPT
jgi:putative NIF3 family GTP cyclohydrolase 1 type 2